MIRNDRFHQETSVVQSQETEDRQEVIHTADLLERVKGICLQRAIHHNKVMGLHRASGHDQDLLLGMVNHLSRMGTDLLVTIRVIDSKLRVLLHRLSMMALVQFRGA
jgi:hypothetical protein